MTVEEGQLSFKGGLSLKCHCISHFRTKMLRSKVFQYLKLIK